MPRVLCLDYGERRIGVAFSDEAGVIAMPLCVINVQNSVQTLREIAGICAEKKPEKIVVGMPLNMDGSRGPKAEETKEFVRRLEKSLGIAVQTWDERLSSRQAERTLIGGDVSRRKRKGVIDKLAAQIVLQGYLDSRGGDTEDG